MTASRALRDLRAGGYGELANRLDSFIAVVARQAATDPAFAADLAGALGVDRSEARNGAGASRKGGRRSPGPFDPFTVYADGEDALRRCLEACDLEELRNIVAEHGMDHDRLAMKWKTPDRLVERIVTTVAARVRKGEAFRAPST